MSNTWSGSCRECGMVTAITIDGKCRTCHEKPLPFYEKVRALGGGNPNAPTYAPKSDVAAMNDLADRLVAAKAEIEKANAGFAKAVAENVNLQACLAEKDEALAKALRDTDYLGTLVKTNDEAIDKLRAALNHEEHCRKHTEAALSEVMTEYAPLEEYACEGHGVQAEFTGGKWVVGLSTAPAPVIPATDLCDLCHAATPDPRFLSPVSGHRCKACALGVAGMLPVKPKRYYFWPIAKAWLTVAGVGSGLAYIVTALL